MRLLWLAVVLFCACPPPPGTRDAGPVDSGVVQPDAGVRDAGGTGCPSGRTLCNGLCLNLRTERTNCGACGRACEVGQLCVAGECRPDCVGGLIDCGGACINPASDPMHCGRCGNACSPVELCGAGECLQVPGRALCNGAITDTLTDLAHCGGCGVACPASATCTAGLCCGAMELNCAGACAQVQTDPLNCGRCGATCGSNQVCTSRACLNCPAGHVACGNVCTDVRADPANCGACGTQCNGSQYCAGSTCACPPVLTACAGDCVDRYSNALHCGACNTPCPGGQLCISGACVPACPAGLTRCGGDCVDTLTAPAACGACAVQCGAGQACDGGACVGCAPVAGADCDHDGVTVGAGGDCCDTPGACGGRPELINPGAFEVATNGVDDNCNGLTDLADLLDVSDCDGPLTSNSPSAIDAAKALDLCRITTAGATGPMKTWGLINAEWQLADGRPLTWADGHSIRAGYGAGWTPRRGAKLLVISSGIAADATQTAPGPNGGPLVEQSAMQGSVANLAGAQRSPGSQTTR